MDSWGKKRAGGGILDECVPYHLNVPLVWQDDDDLAVEVFLNGGDLLISLKNVGSSRDDGEVKKR
jgi:hypothetical protein